MIIPLNFLFRSFSSPRFLNRTLTMQVHRDRGQRRAILDRVKAVSYAVCFPLPYRRAGPHIGPMPETSQSRAWDYEGSIRPSRVLVGFSGFNRA